MIKKLSKNRYPKGKLNAWQLSAGDIIPQAVSLMHSVKKSLLFSEKNLKPEQSKIKKFTKKSSYAYWSKYRRNLKQLFFLQSKKCFYVLADIAKKFADNFLNFLVKFPSHLHMHTGLIYVKNLGK